MDGFKEKKWFVYMTDHHEGPFSLEEIQGRMAVGQILKTYYVWADGMKDWRPMAEITAFEGLFSTPASSSVLTAKAIEEFEKTDPGIEVRIEPVVQAAKEEPIQTVAEPAFELSPVLLEANPIASPTKSTSHATTAAPVKASLAETPISEPAVYQKVQENPQPISMNKAKPSSFLKWAMALIFAMAVGILYYSGFLTPGLVRIQEAAQPLLIQLIDKIPALSGVISPIPALEDVTPEDMQELKAAASAPPAKVGARAALALSQTDVFTPSFYVTSNLPDGAMIDVYIQGIDDTLLNQLSYQSQTPVTITKKMGKTPPVKNLDGKSLTRGEYIFYLVASSSNPPQMKPLIDAAVGAAVTPPSFIPAGSKILSAKSYFLGGRKDAIYTARLKEYHDKLAEIATLELAELKQLSSTLEFQLADTNKHFHTLYDTRTPNAKAQATKKKFWNDYSSKWRTLFLQMLETFKIAKFYTPVYELAHECAQVIGRVHDLQSKFYNPTTPMDRTSFEIQLGEASSQASNLVANLKSKVEQVEKMPPTPNGMPRREGL